MPVGRASIKESRMSVIHKAGLTGKAYCGATPDAFGHLKISQTGIHQFITCPDCIRLDTPNREAQIANLEAAAFRERQR